MHFNGVFSAFSIKNPSTGPTLQSLVLSFNSSDCRVISPKCPPPDETVSDLSDYSLISGAWEWHKECGWLSPGRRRAFRAELCPHCAFLSPPSHYFLQRAGKNLKNQYPFQRPIEVTFYNAPANYFQCVTPFFFSGRGRNAALYVPSVR